MAAQATSSVASEHWALYVYQGELKDPMGSKRSNVNPDKSKEANIMTHRRCRCWN